MTCSPTSTRQAWFSPEAHLRTGRLCSAGSGRYPVPRRPRSCAALRLPCPPRPRLRSSLANGLPQGTGVVLRRPHAHPSGVSGVRRRVTGSPRGRGHPRGRTRASQVPGPSSSCVPWSYTPPGALLPSPRDGEDAVAFRLHDTLGTRHDQHFGAAYPRGPQARVPTYRRVCHHPRRKARYRPGRAHPWPGGIRTRRTTNEVSWLHRISIPPRPAFPGHTMQPCRKDIPAI